jgi:hypothetical protein
VLSIAQYYPWYEVKTSYGHTFLTIDAGVLLLSFVIPMYIYIEKISGVVSSLIYLSLYCLA